MLAAIVGVLFVCLFAQAGTLHHTSAALRAGTGHFNDERLGERTVRIARASQKTPEPSAFNDHIPSANVALLLAHLIGHLEIDTLKVTFSLLEGSVKTVIEVMQYRFPRRFSLFDRIERFFHTRGKLGVNDLGELILHQSRHHFAERRGTQVLPLFDHIFTVEDRGNGGCIGGRTANTVLFHRTDQRRVRVTGRRLREMLLRLEFLQLHRLPHAQRRQKIKLFFLFLIVRLLVDCRIT